MAATLTVEKSSITDAAVRPQGSSLAIGVSLAALALVARSVREGKPGENDQPEVRGRAPYNPPQNRARLAVVAGLLSGYVLLFVPPGYLISASLSLPDATMYLARGHQVRNVAYSVTFALIVYLVFTRLLGTVLAPGPWGI